MYAIIHTGGKQYNIKVGDVVKVEKLDSPIGEKYTFDKVSLISAEDIKIGSPFISGASVLATVLEQSKAKKVVVYKYKSKKGFHKKKGHRQQYTSLKIEAINS